METVIFKIILCSSILIGIYYLFLQREKMFRFNRIYLLFALVFSYAIPFVKVKLPAIPQQNNQLIFDEIQSHQLIQKTSQTSQMDWMNLILIIYVLVSMILVFRSLISIFKIINLKGIDFVYQNQKVKLIEKNLPPFSFWDKIYINESHYENQKIDERILLHETTHLVQKHTLDLIFVEFLQAISWFNPVIYFYKKAMIANHEFLADESIIQKNTNVKDYQTLILSEILQSQNLQLTHQFNYNNTKKRFIMMTTKPSKFASFKKLFAVSTIAGLSILFVQKVYASEIMEQKSHDDTATAIPVEEKDYTDLDKKLVELYKSELKKEKIPRSQTVAEKVVLDTIPKNKNKQLRKLKENELPIPPPPPPARDIAPAEFPEGLSALRMSFSNVFDSSALAGKGTIKSMLYISIDENGKTTDIKAEGDNPNFNKEAIRSMKLVTENKTWKPATEEGKAAATVFKLPLTMQFQ